MIKAVRGSGGGPFGAREESDAEQDSIGEATS